jgi:putative MATE family efflux protein
VTEAATLEGHGLGVSPERRRRIFGLALPIIGGMLSQNVMNLVDTAMVGTLGDAALAGVGLGGFANFLFSSFVLGLSAGVQAMTARRVGEGRWSETAIPLNGGLLLALIMAIPWSALLVATAWDYFPLLTGDDAVVEQGVPYLRARLCAMFAMGMNFSFRGYWNAVDKSILYMRTLISMHVINIFLNWVFIFGNLGAPELGAAGAGVASAAATIFGTASYFLLGRSYAKDNGFLHGLPSRQTVKTIVRVAAPSSIQQFFFAAGMTAFLMLVARMGTPELAATKVIIDLILVGILPGIGFGLAAASLAGQALGRGEPDDAKRWGWDVVKIAVVVVALASLPVVLFPKLLLSIFIHDPGTLALATNPLRVAAGFLFLDAAGMVLMNALTGAGDTKRVMFISVGFQWLLFLPAVYLVGPTLGLGLVAVLAMQASYRGVQALVFGAMWQGGRWQEIELH